MENEIWKDIPEYEGLYQVSNLGNVRSLNYNKTKKIKVLKQGIQKKGYLFITLSKEGKHKSYNAHRLVAKVFIPNPNNLPQVNHKDEDKTNNSVENLEWCSAEYNVNYGTRTDRHRQNMIGKNIGNPKIKTMLGKFGKEHNNSKPINQYTKEGVLIKIWDCAADVKRELGFNQQNIGKCAMGKRKTANGFIWKYA